ncbi:UNVERIFIED_CONTAM: hypothetical protein GTU68_058104 [Idotea baltica]|nr:hypothetical protein [Idotea baltica]
MERLSVDNVITHYIRREINLTPGVDGLALMTIFQIRSVEKQMLMVVVQRFYARTVMDISVMFSKGSV